ncbi:hypothetical protein BBOV_II003325 [Babesia bovis T2Bo]|uniref:hypothetical protein n=1 Tax=Babesia bovis T2Bo TaxID=484906 RepID=UPI001C35DE9A|nr:hypothetical protein BBOV_II003325 [Babesia bovis T2Bo]KAG6440162.1 hypothetical protein BBOV_II003325 [Babesia bovis T2Bo]
MESYISRPHAAMQFLEQYSKASLNNLAQKRCIPTSSFSLNQILGGGIFTQEVTEFVGLRSEYVGFVMINTIIHHVANNPTEHALIISYNGIPNKRFLRQNIREYLSVNRPPGYTNLNDFTNFILDRIEIHTCRIISDVKWLIEDLYAYVYPKAEGSVNSPTHQSPSPPSLSNTSDDNPRKTPAIVMIHTITGIVDDTQGWDLWNLLPEICTTLTGISRKLNAAVIMSSRYGEALMKNICIEAPKEDKDVAHRDVFLLSNRWHSTVDKRIFMQMYAINADAKSAYVAVEVIKAKQRGENDSCSVHLTMGGIDEYTDVK